METMQTSMLSQRWLVRLLIAGVLLLALFPGFGTSAWAEAQDAPSTPPAAPAAGGTVNVELVFDSSGSMAQEISAGVTLIDAAKDVLNGVIDAIPEREGVNVGFRVY